MDNVLKFQPKEGYSVTFDTIDETIEVDNVHSIYHDDVGILAVDAQDKVICFIPYHALISYQIKTPQ